jgi:DNA-binding PadR family transcriptional regulator
MTGRRLNATAASLLGFLHDGALSGYELAATAERRIGDFWSLTQSQVYRELAWMAEAGFVAPGERGTRDRRRYEITDAGRAVFAAWADEPPGAEAIRHPLLLAVSFGRHVPPDRLAAYLRGHREAHAERLRAYRTEERALADGAGGGDPYAAATLAFGIAYERAVLDWFEGLPAGIVEPTAEAEAAEADGAGEAGAGEAGGAGGAGGAP